VANLDKSMESISNQANETQNMVSKLMEMFETLNQRMVEFTSQKTISPLSTQTEHSDSSSPKRLCLAISTNIGQHASQEHIMGEATACQGTK